MADEQKVPLQLKPLKLGAEVFGIDLKKDVPADVVSTIKQLVTKHRLLVFRNQGIVPGERQAQIARWFGELESTFYKHPKSPHPDVFRVSNDDTEGCTRVGRTGWHIDGSFMDRPFSHAVYHMQSVPAKSFTNFVGMKELYDRLDEDQQKRWRRLSMVSNIHTGPVHPVVYTHPKSGEITLCFHLGMIQTFVWDADDHDKRKPTKYSEAEDILREIRYHIVNKCSDLIYHHKYSEEGDLIISDNLAVAHEASEDTQLSREEIGLRVLHRCTIAGESVPSQRF